MPITINLDDEAIDFLAARIALKLAGMDSSQSVNPPQQNTHRTQSDQVSGQDGSGWSSAPPAQNQGQQQQQSQGNGPSCQHGPMKFAKAGYSQSKGKSYPASWRCQGPKGQWCDTVWMDD